MPRIYRVNTLDKCTRFLDKLRANGWSLWQMQYQWDYPEGFHAWFWKAGEQDIELVTFNEEVQKVIIGYKNKVH